MKETALLAIKQIEDKRYADEFMNDIVKRSIATVSASVRKNASLK